MSRLMVKGTASIDYTADIFRITMILRSSSASSGEAMNEGKDRTEQLLRKMQEELDISPQDLIWEADNTQRQYGDRAEYRFSKHIALEIGADLGAAERVKSLLAELQDVEYNISTELANRGEKEHEVMHAAVADSRQKAELIASALGQKIVGMDEVNFEFTDQSNGMLRCAKACCADCDSLASKLQTPVVNISKSIDITWIAE